MNKNPKPFKTGYLPEKDGHHIYFAQYGNPQGEPVVSLHGGPGSKSKLRHVTICDLTRYQVVIFDQRGCGQSTPLGGIQNNALDDLITDMERLREQLKIEKWFVSGGSWGSTLALVYAEKYPNRVKGLLISSIFLGRDRDEWWITAQHDGVERLFPDLWSDEAKFLKKHEATAATAAKVLLKKIQSSSPKKIKEIVAGFSNWEGNLMNAQADLTFTDPEEISDDDIAEVKVLMHYESHNFFLKPNQLLKNSGKIKSIPTIIVHGRYDVLCPADQAWTIHNKLRNSKLIFLPTSNHKLTADGTVARRLAYNLFLERQNK